VARTRFYGRRVIEATTLTDTNTATLQRERDASIRWLLADRRGRRVVWWLLADAGVFRSSMGATPELTAFNEGRRSTGLALLADVSRLCPERFAEMQLEARAEEIGASFPATSKPSIGDTRDDARPSDQP
jgi:hypothetical protein